MAKVGVLIRAYKLTKWLPAVIKQYQWVDRILIMNYRFPNVEDCADDTPEIAKKYGCEIITGGEEQQHVILNKGLKELSDCDCVFISDADEFILREDMDKIVELIEPYDGLMVSLVDYLDFDHSLPIRTHHPIVAVNPNKVNFNDVRCYSGNNLNYGDIVMHHFGYAWKGDELDWKHINKWYPAFFEDMNKPTVDADCPQPIRDLINENTVSTS